MTLQDKLTTTIELTNPWTDGGYEVYIRREDRREYTARLDTLRVRLSRKPYSHPGWAGAEVSVWRATGWVHLISLPEQIMSGWTVADDLAAAECADWVVSVVGRLLS